MSISMEQAEKYKNKVAVLCCRAEEGIILEPSNLEDPNIIPELEDSGLVELPEGTLKIGQVLGAKLLKTLDSLTPLTRDVLDGIKELDLEEVSKEETNETDEDVDIKKGDSSEYIETSFGPIRISIEEGKGIDIQISL